MQINQLTKRSILIAGWALSVVAATYVGFWFSSVAYAKVLSTTSLSSILAEAIQTQSALEKLDNGETKKARESLRLQMDGHILALANFSEYSASEKDRETTNKLLRKISEHRNNHKDLYPEFHTSEQLHEAQTMIAEILKRNENRK